MVLRLVRADRPSCMNALFLKPCFSSIPEIMALSARHIPTYTWPFTVPGRNITIDDWYPTAELANMRSFCGAFLSEPRCLGLSRRVDARVGGDLRPERNSFRP